MLDYKIKELKKQIEPREQEIADMKEQIKEMDGELERWGAFKRAETEERGSVQEPWMACIFRAQAGRQPLGIR